MINSGVRLGDPGDEQRMLRDAATAFLAAEEDGRRVRQ